MAGRVLERVSGIGAVDRLAAGLAPPQNAESAEHLG